MSSLDFKIVLVTVVGLVGFASLIALTLWKFQVEQKQELEKLQAYRNELHRFFQKKLGHQQKLQQLIHQTVETRLNDFEEYWKRRIGQMLEHVVVETLEEEDDEDDEDEDDEDEDEESFPMFVQI